VLGRRNTSCGGLCLADAVAASAAFPGAFAPLVMRKYQFPCSDRCVTKLLDGGAYDNLGLEVVDGLGDTFLVAINAGPASSTPAALAGCPGCATSSASTPCSTANQPRCASAR
jgi:predicted acylesterase/phospholipase RssA